MNILIEENTKYGLVVSSRVIAKELDKQHKNVLADLDKIFKKNRAEISALFIKTKYKALNGKMNKKYLLTKDGFTLYMFNIQGYQEFKMAYIRKFNEMEKALKENKLLLTLKNESIEKEIKTFRGQPVMEVVYLQKLTDIPMSTLHKHTKELNCVIRSSDSREYKRENKISRNIPWITILNKIQVVKICKYFGIYETFQDKIEDYFKNDNKIEFKIDSEKVKKKKIFEDVYLEAIYDDMKKIFVIENKIEKIYDDELKPLYNHMIDLARAKRDLGLSTFECMKYGGTTEKEKLKL